MKRSLAMTVLALGLIAFGCDDEPTTPVDGAAGSGGRGGSGGSGGSGGTGGTGGTGGSGGTGGRAPDARDTAAPTERPRDGRTPDRGPDTAAADRPADRTPDTGGAYFDMCANHKGGALAGISAGDFCGQFMATCSFGTKNRFASMNECVSKYGASTAKGIRAGNLCDAKAGLGMGNCDLAAGFGQRLR
jgi:hypothetical protein